MTVTQLSEPSVLVEAAGSVRILTLNRPAKLNAADLEMQQKLLRHLEEIAADQDARALILTGAGRAFSAGGDRDILRRMAEGKEDKQAELGRVHVATIRCLLGLEIPAIAAVAGPAVGYAAGLVALSDFVVMGPNGFLSDPHVGFGMAATTGTQLVWPRRASEGVVRDILMTGRKVNAVEAVSIGLANRLCSAGQELEMAHEIAQKFVTMPREGIAQTKRAFNRPLFAELEKLLANE